MERYAHGRRKLTAVIVLAVATALCWEAWMGWDIHYDLDAAGQASGPYQPWQVAGCVLSLLVVVCSAGRWLPVTEIVLTMTLIFTLAFAASAMPLAGPDPLVFFGIALVFLAMFVGSVLVAGIAKFAWDYRFREANDRVR